MRASARKGIAPTQAEQKLDGDVPVERDDPFDGGAGALECLHCGHPLRFDELGRFVAGEADRTVFECEQCGTLNEINAEPQPGPGTQPRARVVRTLPPVAES